MKVKASGVEIEVQDTGGAGPAVLLVMGLGMQLIAWPDALVQALAAAGYRVIRHDNRDAGLSQGFDELGTPSLVLALLRQKLGLRLRPPYTLGEMAQDALGVLDALGVRQAHVVGASMGGMIAQRMALAAPERLLSLTSIMSTSGARGLPGPTPEVQRVLLSRPRDAQGMRERSVRLFRLIGGSGFATPEADLRTRVTAAMARATRPLGVQRQLLAILADITRAEQLARIATPTLVIHGGDDTLVPLAAGQDTARRIPGARLAVIDGMGHDLPPGVVDRVLAPLLPHLAAHSLQAPLS